MKQPPCFRKYFSLDAAECVGGEQPGYEHPVTEKNTRDACTFWKECRQITRNRKGSLSVLQATRKEQPMEPRHRLRELDFWERVVLEVIT